ncbi:MAG: hypothetical protein ACPLW7_06270 [Minisyncoccia bacterium]
MRITNIFIFLIISLIVFINIKIVRAVKIPDIITTNKTIWDLINKALSWFFYFIIIVALIMILYTAYLYITSGGDSKKMSTVFKALTYIIIGLIILFLSQIIINTIQNFILGDQNSFSNNDNNTTETTEIDMLSNVSFDELLQESWYHYLDPNCNPDQGLNCCKCCKQGKSTDECGQQYIFAI